MSDQETATPVTPAESPSPKNPVPSDERLLSAVGYIPMLFVAPLIMKPSSKFCQIHGKQGMLMTGITFLVLFILVLVPAIGSLLFLALIGLIAIGAFQANSGVEWKIPFLYEVSAKINVDQLFAGTTVKPTATTTQQPETPVPAAPVTTTPSDTAPNEPSTPPTQEPPKESN